MSKIGAIAECAGSKRESPRSPRTPYQVADAASVFPHNVVLRRRKKTFCRAGATVWKDRQRSRHCPKRSVEGARIGHGLRYRTAATVPYKTLCEPNDVKSDGQVLYNTVPIARARGACPG